MLISFSHVSFCNPMDPSPACSSVHGILQARILEWVAMPSSRGSSRPRDRTLVSCIAGRFFTTQQLLLFQLFSKCEGCMSASVMCHSALSWTVALQAPVSMDFFRQEYWSGLPFLSPGYLLNPGVKPMSLASLLAGRFFTINAIWEAHSKRWIYHIAGK